MLIPSALAVLRLITNSNLVGVSICSSSGFSPAMIFTTKPLKFTPPSAAVGMELRPSQS